LDYIDGFAPVSGVALDTVPLGAMYNALWQFNYDGSVVGDLAKSWQFTSDGLGLTVNLVQNATWHDGTPFTVDDVLNNIAIYTQFQGGSVALSNIASTNAPDKYTLKVTFKNPQPPAGFYAAAGGNFGMVVPKKYYDIAQFPDYTKAPMTTGAVTPVGTGAFKFTKWDKGVDIIFDKNPNYWKPGLPYLDRVIFQVFSDPAARTVAFQKGSIDAMFDVGDSTVISSLQPNYPHAFGCEAGACTIMMMNTRNPGFTGPPYPLTNVQVRQAIAYAINKPELAKTFWLGLLPAEDAIIPNQPAVPSGMTPTSSPILSTWPRPTRCWIQRDSRLTPLVRASRCTW